MNVKKLLSLLLSLTILMSIATVPVMATDINSNDPADWPVAGKSGVTQETPDGCNPMYLYFDSMNPDDAGHNVKTSHQCTIGESTTVTDITKATAESTGLYKVYCDKCGSSASLVIPKFSESMYTLSSASTALLATSPVYTGSAFDIEYDVATSVQRFLGAKVNNDIHPTNAGVYDVIFTMNNDLYDNVTGTIHRAFTINPVDVNLPANDYFTAKEFDGESVINNKTFYYTDVNGNSVPAKMKIYGAKAQGTNSLTADKDNPLQESQAKAAGMYYVEIILDDSNYIFKAENGNTYNTAIYSANIAPKLGSVYVGDAASDISMDLGGTSQFQFVLTNASGGAFSTASAGTSNIKVLAKLADGSQNGYYTIGEFPIGVNTRSVISVPSVSVSKQRGAAFADLGLPSTLDISVETVSGTKTVTVPVVWDSSSYDSSLASQTVTGTMTLPSDLDNNNSVTPAAQITLTGLSVTTPSFTPFTKTFNNNSDSLPLPETVHEGIQSMSVAYSGTDQTGNAYNSTTAPISAGSYTATVSYAVNDGYETPENTEVSYIINQASQAQPTVSVVSVGTDFIELSDGTNLEYSKDGSIWQNDSKFTGLNPGTNYTLYVRVKESADKNYAPSSATSVHQTTDTVGISVPTLSNQSHPWTGSAITYQAPSVAQSTGVSIEYVVNGIRTTTAPSNVGVYDVFVKYALSAEYTEWPEIQTKLIITAVDQTAPAAPIAAEITDTSIRLTTISGAEYSLDNTNWQSSPLFESLAPNTTYTVYARLAADQNHNIGPASSANFTTLKKITPVASVSNKIVTYDGNGKTLDVIMPTGCIKATQTFQAKGYGPSTTAPIDAGTYTVTIHYTMENDYEQPADKTAVLTIAPVSQTLAYDPIVEHRTTTLIAMEAVDGSEYSLDKVHWTTNNVFSNLTPDQSYTIYQRMAAKKNYTASDSKFVVTKTLSARDISFTIDYKSETISFDARYLKVASDAIMLHLLNDGDKVTPGSTIYSAMLDDGTGKQGAAQKTILAKRPTTPILKLSTTNTVNTTIAMEYSLDNGLTWADCVANMSVTTIAGKTMLVRVAATSSSFRSETVSIDIPETASGIPVPQINKEKETVINIPNTEWSSDGGETWKSISGSSLDVSRMPGETIMFRPKSNPENVVSIQIYPRAAKPSVPKINYEKETLETVSGMDFTSSGASWIACSGITDISDYCGKIVYVRNHGSNIEFASEKVEVKIPNRPNAPTVSYTDETAQDMEDGTITKTTSDMEYRKSGGNWKSISGSSVTGLEAGTYEVRYKATSSAFSSNIRKIEIKCNKDAALVNFNVYLEPNNGESAQVQHIKRGSTVSKPKNPTRTGYEFNGWYQDSALTQKYSFSEKVTASFTLYAGWKVKPGSSLVSKDYSWMMDTSNKTPYLMGKTETIMDPYGDVTRGEIAAFLYRLMTDKAKEEYDAENALFSDVSSDDWNAKEISTLNKAGIIFGYQDGTFRSNKNISRAELTTMLSRFCASQYVDGDNYFKDIATHWARADINNAAALGLVQGDNDGYFYPDAKAYRAEAVSMINRLVGRDINSYSTKKTFKDIKPSDWFYDDIMSAANGE